MTTSTSIAIDEEDFESFYAKEEPGTKWCNNCYTVKPLKDFSPQVRGRKGTKPKCKSCMAAYHRARDGSVEVNDTLRFVTGDAIYC